MARITVEDCLDHVDNRFDLVMVATKRARQIATQGKDPLVEADDDKPAVIALKEIELGLVTSETIDQVEVEVEEFGQDALTDQLTEELAEQFSEFNL